MTEYFITGLGIGAVIALPLISILRGALALQDFRKKNS